MKQSKKLYDLTDKERSLFDFYLQTLNKSLRMFAYTDLPVPAIQFEKQLQENGYTVVFEYQDKIYCNSGSLTGQDKSPYGEPTQAIINIPALNLSKTFDLETEAVLVKNDFLQVGLKPLLLSKGTQIIENRLTMYLKNVLSRAPFTITANSDKSIQSAQAFINKLVSGDLAVIAEDSFLKDVNVNSLTQTGQANMQDLINYQTYLYGQLYSEIGLPGLTNEKQERLVTSEVESQQATIRPLVDNMLECRKQGVDKMNKLFNGNTAVELDSVWNNVKQKQEAEVAKAQKTNSGDEVKTEPKQEQEPKQDQEPKQEPESKQEPEKDSDQ